MNDYKLNSGQDIVYIDHSSSGVTTSLSQSSADPTSLASLVCNSLFVNKQYPLIPRTAGKEIYLDFSTLTPAEKDLYLYNVQHRQEEAEDALLVASGVLPKLLAQVMQEPPSVDWERYLDEL